MNQLVSRIFSKQSSFNKNNIQIICKTKYDSGSFGGENSRQVPFDYKLQNDINQSLASTSEDKRLRSPSVHEIEKSPDERHKIELITKELELSEQNSNLESIMISNFEVLKEKVTRRWISTDRKITRDEIMNSPYTLTQNSYDIERVKDIESKQLTKRIKDKYLNSNSEEKN